MTILIDDPFIEALILAAAAIGGYTVVKKLMKPLKVGR